MPNSAGRLFRLARLVVAAGLACASIAGAAHAAVSHPMGSISAKLSKSLAETGAPGGALFIGKKDTVFYVETVGKAELGSSINLPSRIDIAQPMLLLALSDSGFMKLDDPVRNYLTLDKSDPLYATTIRQLMAQRVKEGDEGVQAARSLIMIAESASARSWESLFKQWLSNPLGLEGSEYPKASGLSRTLGTQGPTGILRTNARDYARFLSVLANGGSAMGEEILSGATAELLFQAQMVGDASCLRQSANGKCELIEQDAVGFYAWVDRKRGLYGVLAAPGAEVSIAGPAREIRAEAETILDRALAGAGLTSATSAPDHSTGR